MKKIIISLESIFVFVIIVTIYLAFELRAEDNGKDLFFIKQYGDLKPDNISFPSCLKLITDDRYKNIKYNEYKKSCDMRYYCKTDIDYIDRKILINIIYYGRNNYIKNDMLLKRYKMISNIAILEYDNGGILYYSNNEQKNLKEKKYWISGNYLIEIRSYNIGILEDILIDYISKYPPTVNFNPSDFDIDKIFKKQIDRMFDYIERAEEKRAMTRTKEEKWEAYYAIIDQCNAESNIRCWTGEKESMRKKGCPITMESDNPVERNKKWQEFKEEVSKRPLDHDGINWTDPYRTGCSVYPDSLKIAAGSKLGDEFLRELLGAPEE